MSLVDDRVHCQSIRATVTGLGFTDLRQMTQIQKKINTTIPTCLSDAGDILRFIVYK